MSESEEEFDLNSSEKKPKLSDIHINYEASAKDLNIKIFYRDTDSMHIEKSRLKDLEIEF